MSCATAVPTGFTQADVYDYARQVRLQLADLGPNVVSDLTGGLEADLSESLSEREPVDGRGLADVFGSPASYAYELRASAGLPLTASGGPASPERARRLVAGRRLPRLWGLKLAGLIVGVLVLIWLIAVALLLSVTRNGAIAFVISLLVTAALAVVGWRWWQRRSRGTASEAAAALPKRLRDRWNAAWQPMTSTPTWAKFRDWCAELAPVWWALRGWIVGSFLATAFENRNGASFAPATFAGFLFALAITVLSVQWGRGRWLPWRWLPKLATVLSVAAVLLAIPMYDNTRQSFGFEGGPQGFGTSEYDRGFQAGQEALGSNLVLVEGQPVTNIFAFDADGNPIPAVQLFDERGRPLTLTATDANNNWLDNSVAIDENGQRWFNVPRTASDGRLLWNVFPMDAVREGDIDWDNWETFTPALRPGVAPQAPQWPFLRSAATVVLPEAGPVAGPSPTGAPTAAEPHTTIVEENAYPE